MIRDDTFLGRGFSLSATAELLLHVRRQQGHGRQISLDLRGGDGGDGCRLCRLRSGHRIVQELLEEVSLYVREGAEHRIGRVRRR